MDFVLLVNLGAVVFGLVACVSPDWLEHAALMLFARAKAVRAARREYARVKAAGICEAAGTRVGVVTICGEASDFVEREGGRLGLATEAE